MIVWDPWSNKRVNYLSCIEGKGGVKDNHWSAQNAALFIDLLWNIIYRSTKRRGKCYLKLSKNILLSEFL